MQHPKITLFQSLIPIGVLIPLLSINVLIYGDNTLGGANQFALLTAAAVAAIIGLKLKIPYPSMIDKVGKNLKDTTTAILILLLIGSLAGTWLISGVIPTLIIYGLKFLHPVIFLFACTLICALVSVASGSSWSTIATIGIALLGVGKALGFSEAITAGAIISGAYFGDKMSPLSDTTNLAAAMAKVDLFDHIKYMAITTIPSFTLSSLAFLVIGFVYDTSQTQISIQELTTAIDATFNTSIMLLLVPGIVLILIFKKVAPLPVLFVGSLLGGVFAIVFQPDLVMSLAPQASNYLEASYTTVLNALTSNTEIDTGNSAINNLLSSGGMAGMLNTVWLIICAMVFGGVLEAIGALRRITGLLVSGAKTAGGLVSRTVGACLFVNVTASDQYLAIVVPGKMFEEAYEQKELEPQNLSRTLEDSGTVTSVLVPWNTCGATQSSVLGVATFAYLPFCFFNWISPIMTICFAYLRIRIAKSGNKLN
jgi:NhaC family Na+:H+ antiporter